MKAIDVQADVAAASGKLSDLTIFLTQVNVRAVDDAGMLFLQTCWRFESRLPVLRIELLASITTFTHDSGMLVGGLDAAQARSC